MSRAIVDFLVKVNQETLNEMLIGALAETDDIGIIEKIERAVTVARRVYQDVRSDD
jgi:hypothetical protein